MARAAMLVASVIDALSDDWPGWDEGWALLVFPLGIPLALWGALRRPRQAAIATVAVWAWGLAVFVAWWLFVG